MGHRARMLGSLHPVCLACFRMDQATSPVTTPGLTPGMDFHDMPATRARPNTRETRPFAFERPRSSAATHLPAAPPSEGAIEADPHTILTRVLSRSGRVHLFRMQTSAPPAVLAPVASLLSSLPVDEVTAARIVARVQQRYDERVTGASPPSRALACPLPSTSPERSRRHGPLVICGASQRRRRRSTRHRAHA